MNKIKIFSSENYLTLEKAINKWLEENDDIKILHIGQSECALNCKEPAGSIFTTTLSIFYIEPFESE